MYRFLILSDFFQKMPMRISTYSDIGGEFANDGTLSIGSLTSFRGVQSLIKIYLKLIDYDTILIHDWFQKVKFFKEKKIDTSLTGIWTLGHRKACFPPLIMSLWWFHVSSQSPERALEDSGVANDEKTDNQNDAEKVQKILSSIFKKMIIYEACCLVNFTFCCSSASIWL